MKELKAIEQRLEEYKQQTIRFIDLAKEQMERADDFLKSVKGASATNIYLLYEYNKEYNKALSYIDMVKSINVFLLVDAVGVKGEVDLHNLFKEWTKRHK